jgi:hypothetical protein
MQLAPNLGTEKDGIEHHGLGASPNCAKSQNRLRGSLAREVRSGADY